jgi:hypothetical protein
VYNVIAVRVHLARRYNYCSLPFCPYYHPVLL